MAKIQQDVHIYKEKAFAAAQRQFEKDLKKRQREGWKLISVTPTKKKGFGRIVQLTAIYEKGTIYSNTMAISGQPPVVKRGTKIAPFMRNSTKEFDGTCEKIKDPSKRSIEIERPYASTLNPGQLHERKHRSFLFGSIILLLTFIICAALAQTVVRNPDIQTGINADLTPQPTDTPVPTPTPISLITHQGVEAYAEQILDNPSLPLYGNREGITYTESIKKLQVLFYIPGSQVWNDNDLKNKIEANCFYAQQMFWTSRLKGVVGSITVHIQSDLVDKYGNESKGEVGTATLTSATDQMIQWDNIFPDSTWNDHVYDEQWMLPSVEHS